jgi:hypothetical protein
MTTVYWADGFDTYPSLTELGLVYSLTPRLFSTSLGRFSGGAPGSDANGGGNALAQPMTTALVDGWYGVSAYWDSANGARACQMLEFRSASGLEGCVVFDSTSLNVKAYRGSMAGTLLGTSANNVFSANTWMRIEVRYKLDPAAGVVEVWINGTQVLNLTAQNTRTNAAATAISLVYWPAGDQSGGNRWTGYIDDITISDTRLGDLRIARVAPNADSTPNNGTLSTGVNHYAVVNEARYDTTTYTDLTNTVNQEERFGVAALPTTPDIILAVMPISVRQKTAAGNAAAYNVVRSGTSEMLGTYTQLTTSWQIQRDIIQNDPATSAAWSASAVGSMKLAYRVA